MVLTSTSSSMWHQAQNVLRLTSMADLGKQRSSCVTRIHQQPVKQITTPLHQVQGTKLVSTILRRVSGTSSLNLKVYSVASRLQHLMRNCMFGNTMVLRLNYSTMSQSMDWKHLLAKRCTSTSNWNRSPMDCTSIHMMEKDHSI